nr:cbb3-type cytochrome oxidase assembly protein CcoS [uncultured Dongia sp.]
MTILLFLIPIALLLGGLGLGGFLWAMRSGQFDDLDGAAQRILFDDPVGTLPMRPSENTASAHEDHSNCDLNQEGGQIRR